MKTRELGAAELACQLVHDNFSGWAISSIIVEASGPFTETILKKAWKQIYLEQPLLRARVDKCKDEYFFVLDTKFEDIPFKIYTYSKKETPINQFEKEFDSLFPSEKYLWRFKWFKSEQDTNKSFLIFSYNHILAAGGSAYNIIHELLYKCKNILNNKPYHGKSFDLLPKMENILSGSPTFDEFMCKKQNQMDEKLDDGSKSPANTNSIITSREFDKYAPVGQRKTHSVFKSINESSLKKIMSFSKKNDITVNQLLNGILIKTIKDKHNSPVNPLLITPIDLKSYCTPKVPEMYFGLYMGIIPVSITISDNKCITDYAKDYKKAFELGLDNKVYYYPKDATVKEVNDNIICEEILKKQKKFGYNFMITNMGVFKFPETKPFNINSIHLTTGREGGDLIMLIALATVNNKMFITFSYTYPLLSDKNASIIIDNYFENLSKIE